jgi:uncharacterized protein YbaA (DUF1428 family)
MLKTIKEVEMLRLRLLSVAVASLLVLLASACGGGSPPETTTAGETAAEVTTAGETVEATTAGETATEATTAGETAAEETTAGETAAEETTANETIEQVFEDFDPNNFDDSSANIGNEWLPLQPGRQWVYEGVTVEDDEAIPHRLEFIVTDLTKEIAGVNTVVAWIGDYSDDELVEAEIAFYAQDNDGNVWFLGEYPEEYEDGKFVDAPTWIAGLAGAKAGIKMWAEPQPGTPSYYQGWGPAVDWSDYGRVDQMGQETCVPVDCYEDVLVIDESSLDETDAFQVKYYAPEVGNVRVGWKGEDATQEELELVEFGQLGPKALAEVRAAAMELEQHAYEISPGVYAHTTPAEQTLVAEVPLTAESESPEPEFAEFDPNNFDRSTNIDNKWLPLQPGTRLIYEGVTVEDDESIPHRIVFTVTDLTKEIAGVNTVVAWIVDYADGDLVEMEIAFYAQDNDGNVWYLGEYPEEYEEGEFIAAPTWIAGLEEAKAGIKMWAEPQPGMPSYFQGWGPAVDWSDYAQVDQMGQETCVPEDCYEDVLVIAESSLDEPDAFQLKYHAPGVGDVRVGWRGADESQEELELIDIVQLGPEALATAREEALKLEERAYEISPDVYAQTAPAESMPVAEAQ